MNRGRLFVISAPSGAGKTSLVKALCQRKPSLRVSVSHTTRQRRPAEEHGREYFFVAVTDFESMAAKDRFLEHAKVFDNYYGTHRETVEKNLADGADVVLEIDWQGARLVRAVHPECTSIFILPPSRLALEERLRKRQTDSEEVIARRLRDAVGDMSHWDEFDYVVVNDDFEQAAGMLVRIIEGKGEEFRSPRPDLKPLIAALVDNP